VGSGQVLTSRVETSRLAALHEYGLLDTPADDELTCVVRLAARIAQVPTATLNLIDEHRQCQLTTVGFTGADSPRSESMCAVRFESGELVHVPDASQHPDYAGNPWVDGRRARVRFYASAPLITPTGFSLGTLCVFDSDVHTLTADQLEGLSDAARVIVALFERRRQARRNTELAEQARQRETFINTILDTIDVAVTAADPHGRPTLFNRAARTWYGLDAGGGAGPDQRSGQYALFRADGLTFLREQDTPISRALRDGEVHNAELIIRRRNGPAVHAIANARALHDGDGTLIGAVAAMSDVTADRAQRSALQRAHAELADRSGQLAATIAELRRSNTELTQFAAAVSHDLVAPLAAVHGYLDLLETTDGLDDEAAGWVTAACRAVIRMQDLIEALLEYARAGHSRYRPQPTPLNDIVAQTLLDLSPAVRASGATIEVGELPVVRGDGVLLRQLLQNLIGNAIKYRHPERACQIAITATPSDRGWRIAVADNGLGIPAEDRERIFDMFTRLEPVAHTGHGIGLATCQRIIDRHGGIITAAATPGGGTTITFTLPA
jgi:PAS domain S-box-containing protein